MAGALADGLSPSLDPFRPQPNARLAEGAFELGRKTHVRCMMPAEPNSRSLVRQGTLCPAAGASAAQCRAL